MRVDGELAREAGHECVVGEREGRKDRQTGGGRGERTDGWTNGREGREGRTCLAYEPRYLVVHVTRVARQGIRLGVSRWGRLYYDLETKYVSICPSKIVDIIFGGEIRLLIIMHHRGRGGLCMMNWLTRNHEW